MRGTRGINRNPGVLINLTGIDQNKLSQYVSPKRADQAISTAWTDCHDQVIGGLEGGVPGIGGIRSIWVRPHARKRTKPSVMRAVTTQGDVLTATWSQPQGRPHDQEA